MTEMAVARDIVRDSSVMYRLMTFPPEERPITIQLTGRSPEEVAAAVDKVKRTYKPDLIDINAGCPVTKMCSVGSGAAMTRDTKAFETIIAAAARAAYPTPLSVKMRVGFGDTHINVQDSVKAAENGGALFVIVHARTADDRYDEPAQWHWIEAAKRVASIPIIGNGDIFTARDVKMMMEQTGCDGVMIARGALGNPWLFDNARRILRGDDEIVPTPDDIVSTLRRQVQLTWDWMGEFEGLAYVRKHICWYTKALDGSTSLRHTLFTLRSPEAIDAMLASYQEKLASGALAGEPPEPWVEHAFLKKVAFWTLEPEYVAG